MKKVLPILTILAWIVLGVVSIGSDCSNIVGGAPTNLKVEADTDSTVKLTWNAPTEGTPDKYIVYFQEVGASSFTMIANNVTTTSFVHDPGGKTGTYKVAAKFGSEEYTSLTTVSTVPVHTAATDVAELNAAGSSGYGWSRTDGTGSTYSMEQAANAATVDFYISDWAAGHSGTTYYIVSPDVGPTDPGGVVPTGSWHVNGFSAALSGDVKLLPAHVSGNYYSSQEITQYPFYTGCWMYDNYFALVKISDFNSSASTVKAETWFQLVKGLRLIQH